MKTEQKDFRDMTHGEWCASIKGRLDALLTQDPRKAWKWILGRLPYINEAAIEKRCGFRKGKIYDAKAGRAKLTDCELKRIHRELKRLFGASVDL